MSCDTERMVLVITIQTKQTWPLLKLLIETTLCGIELDKLAAPDAHVSFVRAPTPVQNTIPGYGFTQVSTLTRRWSECHVGCFA